MNRYCGFTADNVYERTAVGVKHHCNTYIALSKKNKILLTNDNNYDTMQLEKFVKGVVYMLNNKKSTIISIGVCFFIGILLLFFVSWGPTVFELYLIKFRGLSSDGVTIKHLKHVFVGCFYPCAVFAGVILGCLLKLLFNIKKDKTFISQNVRYLEIVSWCCFIIAIITAVGGCYYMPFFFVSAASGFVGMLLRVLKNVLHSAVEISQENALTI